MEISIIGSGIMGKGIAIEFLKFGYKVNLISTIRETDLNEIYQEVLKIFEKQKILELDLLKKLKLSHNLKLINNSSLIIEAIVEDLSLKKSVMVKSFKLVKKDAIFATNSSSLTAQQIFGNTEFGKRAISLHFFNPVHKMELVEISTSENVDEDVIELILALIKSIRKTPVFVKNYPGLIVNRLLMPMISDAIQMYESGVATKEDIDTSIKLGLKHPMGPLELSDFIGNDIVLNILKNFKKTNKKIEIPRLLEEMVLDKKLGRKTKVGFYNYLSN